MPSNAPAGTHDTYFGLTTQLPSTRRTTFIPGALSCPVTCSRVLQETPNSCTRCSSVLHGRISCAQEVQLSSTRFSAVLYEALSSAPRGVHMSSRRRSAVLHQAFSWPPRDVQLFSTGRSAALHGTFSCTHWGVSCPGDVQLSLTRCSAFLHGDVCSVAVVRVGGVGRHWKGKTNVSSSSPRQGGTGREGEV